MASLESIGGPRRTPTRLLGAGLFTAGATFAAVGALGVSGSSPTLAVAFAVAAGLSLAVLLAGAGLALDSSPTRHRAVSWERSGPGPQRATDGGDGDPGRR